MQFVKNGPDVPERLLQAHEDGRVVFFCGAGISYPAGLPGFGDLVSQLFSEVGAAPNSIESVAIRKAQHDIAIGLLEGRVRGGRATVRNKLVEVLTAKDLSQPRTTATHEALLTLSEGRDGRFRLITTNCDRIFEKVISERESKPPTFVAPLLPVPKTRWIGGLVYLHGLLPAHPRPEELEHIVISSGDFGLAYLTERWAARFVSELFRNFIVCFVGYSINDPVLRYMTDALAADRALGESSPEMYAFVNFKKGTKEATDNEWRAKNVKPILYRNHYNHAYLHRTLKEWSAIYRDGISGKEGIVAQFASNQPLASTKADDFVGRMIWALSDKSALPAKYFADFIPLPSLDWLEPLSGKWFGYGDLGRFGVQPNPDEEQNLEFSLLSRPASYDRTPWMKLFSDGRGSTQWDEVMEQMARWLVRHLDNPNLILWIAKNGGVLHPLFAQKVTWRLENNQVGPAMQILWDLVLSGRLIVSSSFKDLFRWADCFSRSGWSTALHLRLRRLLEPRVVLRPPFPAFGEGTENGVPEQPGVNKLVHWDVVLAAGHSSSGLGNLKGTPQWEGVLPDLLMDSTALLLDAMNLMRELGGTGFYYDSSFYARPSIGDHSQNHGFQTWTTLIELVRDSWVATAAVSPKRALHAVEYWMELPFPVFRRLAFSVAAESSVVHSSMATRWLLSDGRRWLWALETRREAVRLLVSLASSLDDEGWGVLESAILDGPPLGLVPGIPDEKERKRAMDRGVWFRLSRAREAGATLSETANGRLDDLRRQYPEWQLAEDQSDEFPTWVGDIHDIHGFRRIPEDCKSMIEWIRRSSPVRGRIDSDWRLRCENDMRRTAAVLVSLAKRDEWEIPFWRDALYGWSSEAVVERSWRCVAKVVEGAPDDFIGELVDPLSSWLEAVSKVFSGNDGVFFALIRQILLLSPEQPEEQCGKDPIYDAINHPVGKATQALINWLFRQEPQDQQGLPQEIEPMFSELCDTATSRFRHGRVLLAAHVISLFRIDRPWACRYLIPLFHWETDKEEARAAWFGFSWSPRLYRPLLEVIKDDFLGTAGYFEQLGEYGRQYVSALTFAALEPGDTFSSADLRSTVAKLPEAGLEVAAENLASALEGAGNRGEEHWRNRIRPFLKNIWPKSESVFSPGVSAAFARLFVSTRDAFPEAMKEFGHWLQPVKYYGHAISMLSKSDLPGTFPDDTLDYLSRTVRTGDGNLDWDSQALITCLQEIRKADPSLEKDTRFQKLSAPLKLRNRM